MLTVIKRNRKIDDFDLEKIKRSISKISDDIRSDITQKELDLLATEIENRIIELRGIDGKTSTFEIRALVIRELKNMGYSKVADSFYQRRE